MYDKEGDWVWWVSYGQKRDKQIVLFGLVWFYGVSTILGYLMPNPFLYIKQLHFKQFSSAKVQFFVYTQ